MALAKIHRSGRVTLPAEARAALRIEEGRLVAVEVVEGGVLIKPATEAEAAIAEGLEDLGAGRTTPAFDSMDELEAHRATDAYRALIRDPS